MPSYELSVIIRKLSRPDTAAVLKRTLQKIYDTNGVLFAIEHLGMKPFPYRMRRHGKWNTEGSYFLIKFDSPARAIEDLHGDYERDVDIVRNNFIRAEAPTQFECTLEEEMKPPAYRKDVQELIEQGKSKERKFEFNTGLKYNPFGK